MMMRGFAIFGVVLISLAACTGSQPGGFAPSSRFDVAARTCVTSRYGAPFAPAYAKTIWPSEKHDQWRTAAVDGGLPSTIHALRAKSVALPPAPEWGYVGLDGSLYVLGGQPFIIDIYTKLMLGSKESEKKLVSQSLAASEAVKPYVARIDPVTLATTILYFPKKHGVNYIGGMLVDSNGYLYAVARAVLYKIDPKTFAIVAWKRLPLATSTSGKPNTFTSYNGMQATAEGDLVLKGFASFGGGPGVLVKVDPNDLSIKVKTESTAIGGARIALARSAGQQYVYNAGASDSIRFAIGATSFALDDAFSQQYLFSGSGSTEGTSEVYMGNGVVFTSNTTPTATTPITIFAQAASDGSTISSRPAFSSSAGGWNWEMPTGDPYQTGIAAAQDQLSGQVAGFRVCSGGASTAKLWENRRIQDSVGLAINSRASQLYAEDRHCAKKVCTLDFVVLNLKTGREIARTKIAGTEPSMGQIFVGPHNMVFHLASDTSRPNGYITRITAGP